MLSISPPLNAGQAEKYYSRDNYYLESQGEWYGSLANDLQLTGKQTTEEDFAAYLRGFTPEGYAKYKLGFEPGAGKLVESAGQKFADGSLRHRSGIDLTFSCPKSVSILAYSDDRIQAAFNVALKQTLTHIEQNYTQTRHKENGQITFEKTNNCLFSTFNHMTSRELDPQLHAHVIMYNMTKSKDGQIMTTHNDQLFKNKMYLGQHFRNNLAVEMQKLGYQLDVTDRSKGFFEVRGVDKPIIDAFSKRAEDIKEKVKEFRALKFCDCNEAQLRSWALQNTESEKDSPEYSELLSKEINRLSKSTALVYSGYEDAELAALVTLDSREPKKNVTKEKILEQINKTCSDLNTNLEEITSKAQSQLPTEIKISDIVPATVKIQQAVEAVTEGKSVFTKEDILQQAMKLSIGEYDEQQLTTAFNQYVQKEDIALLGKSVSTSGINDVFTSREMKDCERNIIDICRTSKTNIRVSKEISGSFIERTDLTLKLNNTFQLREKNTEKANKKWEAVLADIKDPSLRSKIIELKSLVVEKGNDPAKPTVDIMAEIAMHPELKDIVNKHGYGFTPGQKDALNQMVSTECQFSVIQGDAGTGKSFSMKFAKDLLLENGYKVNGMAPTGKAADELASSAELANSTTLHDFILRWERKPEFRSELMNDKGKIAFVLDEAGMVGSKNALKIMKIAKEIDAKVVFVGDRKQFASIEAGKIFSELQDKAGVDMSVMEDVMRQETDQTKDIVAAISKQDYNSAFNIMQGYTEQVLPKEYTTANFKKGQIISFDGDNSQLPEGTNAVIANVKDEILTLEYTDKISGEKKAVPFLPKEEEGEFRVYQKDDSQGYVNTINEITDDDKRIEAVSKDYLSYYDKMLKNPKLDAIVITPTNDERVKLNTKIREDLVNRGLVENKGEFTLRESNNLGGEAKMLATNYEVGQVFVANSAIKDMKGGNNGKIVSIDQTKNTLTIEYTDKDTHKDKTLIVDVAKYSKSFSTFKEIKTHLGVNDKIAFLKNDNLMDGNKRIKVRNGQLAIIESITESGDVTVRMGVNVLEKDSPNKGKSVTFNVNGVGRNQYSNLTHAFCLSEIKSQGMTVNKLIWSANAKKNITANSFYVAITRCKQEVSVYTDDVALLKKKASLSQAKESTLDYDPEFRNKIKNSPTAPSHEKSDSIATKEPNITERSDEIFAKVEEMSLDDFLSPIVPKATEPVKQETEKEEHKKEKYSGLEL